MKLLNANQIPCDRLWTMCVMFLAVSSIFMYVTLSADYFLM